MNAPAYAALAAHHARLHRLEHLQSVATWDRMTNMPRAAAGARAQAQGEFAVLLQEMAEDPKLDPLFDAARREDLGGDEARNLALMERQRTLVRAVPGELARRREAATGASMAAWHEARARGGWSVLEPALGEVVACMREVGDRLGDALGVGRYDALLDEHEPGLRSATLDTVFGGVREWLPQLLQTVLERRRDETAPLLPQGSFERTAQLELCRRVIALLGFDFSRGRLDTTAHPFTGGVPEDVRLATWVVEANPLATLQACMHEAGHGCYQQNLPRAWIGQPIAGPASASLHEGQALSFERQLAPRLSFCRVLSGMLVEAFGAQPAFEAANLHRLLTAVKPNRVRVESDEITYAFHILLRHEIEHALIAGDIGVRDMPTLWAQKMKDYLEIDAPGDDRLGAMQDMHWPGGTFGYFPTYLLGAMVAAQDIECLSLSMDIDAQVGTGDLAPISAWLKERVWSRGARGDLDATMREATGRALDAGAWRRHLERRYAGGGEGSP